MSASRKGRKLKLSNPEEQPQISQFTVDIGQSPTNTPSPINSPLSEAKGKKRRRSTGEKIPSTKKGTYRVIHYRRPQCPSPPQNPTMPHPQC